MEIDVKNEKPAAVPVMLFPGQWRRLRQESLDTGRSASAIIRDLVAAHLAGRGLLPKERRSAK